VREAPSRRHRRGGAIQEARAARGITTDVCGNSYMPARPGHASSGTKKAIETGSDSPMDAVRGSSGARCACHHVDRIR
jgi:hypothetical protein